MNNNLSVIVIRATVETEDNESSDFSQLKDKYEREVLHLIKEVVEKEKWNKKQQKYEVVSEPHTIEIFDGCIDIFIDFILKPLADAVIGICASHVVSKIKERLECKNFKVDGCVFECDHNKSRVYDGVIDARNCVIKAHDCLVDAQNSLVHANDCKIDARNCAIKKRNSIIN